MGELKKRLQASAAAPFSSQQKDWAMGTILAVRKQLVLDPQMWWHISMIASTSKVLWTPDVPYIAVETINSPRDPDHGRIIQWVNPEGWKTLYECDSRDPLVTAVAHENVHIHLEHTAPTDHNLSRLGDPLWTLAQELCINGHYLVGKWGMELPAKDGKIIVVDPESSYRSYVEGCKKEGLEWMPKAHFLRSEYVAYAELSKLQKPPAQRQMGNTCGVPHGASGESGEGGEPGSSGGVTAQGTWKPGGNNPEALDQAMERIYSAAVRAAKDGDKNAERTLHEVMEQHPEMEKMWSSTGAYSLRGKTSRTQKGSTMWTRHVRTTLASKLGNGYLWVWNRRTPWEDRFTPRGRMPRKHGAVFIDSSGSMPADLIEKVSTLVGKLNGVTVDWHWFDASVGPFVPGGEILGGGGTSFQAIEDHLCGHGRTITAGKGCCKKYPDFVVVLTDGYAPEISPSRPNRWVWLVTRGGDMWPEKAGMSAHEVHL